jgi:hypothetical protein
LITREQGPFDIVRANFKPVDPDKQRREMQREFKGFNKSEPSAERTERLAEFTRLAHVERQLNMAMHTAVLCLTEDPEEPALLIAAYTEADQDHETRLRAWTDLQDLARYIDRPDIAATAKERLRDDAETWLRESDTAERRSVIRVLANIVDRSFADDVKDAVHR